MTDDHYAPQPVARWYMAAAIASLLFMALGCASYVWHVTLDPAGLPVDQRAIYDAVPTWMTAAFAIAVWAGLAGALMLVMKRKLAQPLLLVSLIAVLVQFAGYFVDPKLRQIMTPDAYVLPVVIMLLTWTIFWFARHSAQRGWLR